MSRFLLVGDLHISDVPPASRNEQYLTQLFAKLQSVFDIARANGVDAVVLSGDIFHRRSFSDISIIVEMIKWFRAWQKEFRILSIAGNHDMSLKNQSVAGQPYSLLEVSRAFEHIPAEGLIVGNTVVVGRDFTRSPSISYFTLDGKSTDYSLMVTHADLVPTGFEGYGNFLQYGALDLRNIDVLFNGHLHAGYDVGVYGECSIVNPGSIARVSRDDRRETVAVCLAVFEEEAELRRIAIPCEKPEVVFKAKVEIVSEEVVHIDVDKIVAQMSQVDVEAPWETVEMSPEVRDTVEKYIDRAKVQTV